MSRKSIFELEKRFDLDSEINKLLDDYLNRRKILSQINFERSMRSLLDLIDATILDCPFVSHSRSFSEYLSEYGINEMDVKDRPLYICEFLMNYIFWLSQNGILKDEREETGLFNITNIIYHIHYIVEKSNYKFVSTIDKYPGFEALILVKRDADVDSVLHLVEKEVRLDVLSYLDHKNENDLDEKMNILRRLYIDLESRKKELYKEPNKRLYSDTTALLNNVRHHRNDFTAEDMMKNCDLAFYHYIHLMRANYLYENKDLIDELKKKNN